MWKTLAVEQQRPNEGGDGRARHLQALQIAIKGRGQLR
jgi:hypothetical protein